MKTTKACVAALMLAVAAAGAAAGPAWADCKFQKIADVPVVMEGPRPTITAQVNGKDMKFLVDTGAFFGGVTPEASERLGMKRSSAPMGLMVSGAGGQTRDARAVRADSFTFAGLGFRDTEFLVVGRIGDGLEGNIGENLMGPFDVEYDLANGVIRYFKPDGCGYDTNLAYWSKGMTLSRLPILDPGKIVLKIVTNAKIDGHTIRVQWDSGASVSILNRPAAARVGVTVNSPGSVNGGTTYGIFGKGLDLFQAPFQSFAVGDEEIKNTQLRVTDLGMRGEAEMVLGADFFLSHRILISNSQKKVYFTYNGGPVFRLESQPQAPATQQAAGGSPTGPGAGPATGGQEPKTAAEFARRAAARSSRREFVEALADYTQAITLEPDNAGYYRARGMTRLQARQPVLAMADLDEALKRQPNDPETLLARGELYLASRDLPRARTDFEAAIRQAPDRPDLPAMEGNAYAIAGQYDLAIAQLDAWVAAHSKGENLAVVLGSRCFARAAAGKELEKALADCDAAVRKDPVSQMLQTRALVLLRLGRHDEAIAQYTAALKAQPRDASALYGRGLAELKKGQKTESDADLAAATAITPTVGAQYKQWGLAPETPAPAKS